MPTKGSPPKSTSSHSSSSKPEKPGFFNPKRYVGKSSAEYKNDYGSLSKDDLQKKNVSSRLKRDRERAAAITSTLHKGTGLVYHVPVHVARLKKVNAKVGATDSLMKNDGVSRPEIDWGDRLVAGNKGMADGAFHLRTIEQVYKTSQKPAVKQAWESYKAEVREAYASGNWNPTTVHDYGYESQ